MKKGILFDLDGTLWDSSEQVVRAWNKCIHEKTERPEQISSEFMRNSCMGKILPEIAKLIFPEVEEAERLRILKMCSEEELGYLSSLTDDRPPLYPDEHEIIRTLAQEYTLGIVSNCQSGYIEIYLSQIDFAEAFTDIECAGNTGLSKGDNIKLLMERQGIEKCVYVGDTQGDANAAKEAGIPFIYAAYGFGKADNCTAVLDDIRKLPELVKTII
ncbi:MAG: HAD family hydrolase [Ruminococcus sp.]|nr:HAD family hydrolase [Ruminococcus sp.]